MALEVIVNLLLLAGCVGFFINVSTTMPHSAVNELGAEQWPQAILILLILAICFNLYKYFKNNRREEILVVVMALMYEPVGFMVTCLLFLIAYGLLLGQRNLPLLLLTSVVITVILYIGFSVMLGVMLPRGQILPLRNFALFIESLVPSF